jgi:hypothetical protein
MKRFCLIAASLLVICVLATAAWAEESPVQPAVAPLFLPLQLDLLLVFPDDPAMTPRQDVLGLSHPPPRVPHTFTLETSTRAQPSESQLHLLGDRVWNVFWSVSAASSLADLKVASEGEILSDPLSPMTRVGTVASQYYLLRLEYDPVWVGGTYGVEYRFVGKDFKSQITTDLTSDQEGITLWGKWRIGVVQMRTALAEWWNNVDNDPNQPRMTAVQGEVAIDIDLPDWPRIGFSYARGTSESSDSQQPQLYWHDTLGVTLYYSRSLWEATLASTYATTTDRHQTDSGSTTLNHELSVLYHPVAALTIAPALRFGTTWFRPSEAQTTTSAASLSLTYRRLFKAFDVTMYGGYENTKSSDGYVDTRIIDTAATFLCDLGTSPLGKISLSFKVIYNDYLDHVYATASSTALFGEMRLRLAFS